jgi:outer membrane protein TolC
VTLDSLLAVALRHNPGLRAREADVEAARERVPRAGALPDPQLSWEYEGAPLRDPAPTSARENRLRLTQMLPFPGKQALMKSIMADEVEMAAAEQHIQRLEVLAELHRAFYDLWLLYASIEVIEQGRRNVRAMVDVARARYEVGRAMQQDLLKANVELAMEETRLAVIRQRIPAAEARLNALLGRPASRPLGRPALAPEASGDTLRLPALTGLALGLHPMLRMQESAVARERHRVRLAGKEGWPDLMVGAGYMGMKDEPDAWMGMLAVTLPIWRGKKVEPLKRETRASLASAEAEQQNARNEVIRMVSEAWAVVESARTMTLLYTDSVLPQAEQSLAAARAGYETDRGGFLDLLDAQRSLLRLRLEYEESRAEYLKGRADLARAVGDPEMLGVRDE